MTRTSFRLLSSCAAAFCALSWGFAAQAQVPSAQTGTASPARAGEQFMEKKFEPRVMPHIEVQDVQTQTAPEGADQAAFQFDRLVLEGVTVYSEADLAPVYADRLGTVITLADLYGIAADLTRKYRNEGYVLTQVVVPPQTIEGGAAKLQVVEGFIDSVKVQGEDQENARALIESIAARAPSTGRALNVRDLERVMLLINDLPGVTARGVLSPSKNAAGAADLLITYERDPYDGMIGIDNYGSRYLGPVQVLGAFSLNSYFGTNEKITGQIVEAMEGEGIAHEMLHVGLNYKTPVFDNGTTVEIFGSATITDPGFRLQPFDAEGISRYAGVRVEHPFIRTRALNLSGRATVDIRNVHSDNNVSDTLEDHIRTARLGGRFEFIDKVLGTAWNTVDAELTHGLDIFGSTDENDINVSRFGTKPDFVKLNAELQRLQRLSPEMNLLVGLTGQWANDRLLSSEEFGVGGINYGRAYDQSEILGDSGIAGKIELQWNEPYEISHLEEYQLFGFFDAGKVWNTDPATIQLKTDTMTSTGLGIRAHFTEATTAGFIVAFPLNRNIDTENNKNPRFYANLYHEF